MRQAELARQHAELRSLIRRIGHNPLLREGELELHSHWAKYLCILTAGFLENSLRLSFAAYVRKQAAPRVADFVDSRLARIQNPKAQNVMDLSRAFDAAWAKELEKFLDDDNRRDAIDSIMNNRHQIAHGRHSSITVARVDQYLRRIADVVTFLERQLGL